MRLKTHVYCNCMRVVDSGLKTRWIQVDSSGFRWIRTLLIREFIWFPWAFSHEGGGFSATTPTLYNTKSVYERPAGSGAPETSQSKISSRILRRALEVKKWLANLRLLRCVIALSPFPVLLLSCLVYFLLDCLSWHLLLSCLVRSFSLLASRASCEIVHTRHVTLE